MYNSQYYTCEQIDQRLLQGYVDDYNYANGTHLTKDQFLNELHKSFNQPDDPSGVKSGTVYMDGEHGTVSYLDYTWASEIHNLKAGDSIIIFPYDATSLEIGFAEVTEEGDVVEILLTGKNTFMAPRDIMVSVGIQKDRYLGYYNYVIVKHDFRTGVDALINSNSVLFNSEQSIPEVQQAQARQNIGIGEEIIDTSSDSKKVYLKKNIVTIEGVEKNVLVQDAFYKDGDNNTRVPNTDKIFVVGYDFDLNGATINVPAGCALEFNGGKVINGKLISNSTRLINYDGNSNALYGLYYDKEGELLNFCYKDKGDFILNTCADFVEDAIDVEASNYQSLVKYNNYLFVLGYLWSDNTMSVFIRIFDAASYAYIGTCNTDVLAHVNGATIANGKIYIAPAVSGDKNLYVIDCDDVIEGYQHEVTATSTAIDLSYLEPSVGFTLTYINGIDYDAVHKEFAVLLSPFYIAILDENLTFVRLTKNVSTEMSTKFDIPVSNQDIVYKNGIVYCGFMHRDEKQNYYNYHPILIVVDSISGDVVDYKELHTPATSCEPQGLFKDPEDERNLWILLYKWNSDSLKHSGLRYICKIAPYTLRGGEKAPLVSDGKPRSLLDNSFYTAIYIDNTTTNSRQKGSKIYPYKTLEQAYKLAKTSSDNFAFMCKKSEIDYDIDFGAVVNKTLRIQSYGDDGVVNIIANGKFYGCYISTTGVNFKVERGYSSFKNAAIVLFDSKFVADKVSVKSTSKEDGYGFIYSNWSTIQFSNYCKFTKIPYIIFANRHTICDAISCDFRTGNELEDDSYCVKNFARTSSYPRTGTTNVGANLLELNIHDLGRSLYRDIDEIIKGDGAAPSSPVASLRMYGYTCNNAAIAQLVMEKCSTSVFVASYVQEDNRTFTEEDFSEPVLALIREAYPNNNRTEENPNEGLELSGYLQKGLYNYYSLGFENGCYLRLGCRQRGTTEQRPNALPPFILKTASMYFDTTLNRPVWWNGSSWVDIASSAATSVLYGKTINFLGDSYVANNGQPFEQTWEARLGAKYDMIVNNYGINGNGIVSDAATGTPMYERYVDMINNVDEDEVTGEKGKVDYVIVIGGKNDYNQQLPIADFKVGLVTLIEGLIEKYTPYNAEKLAYCKIAFFTPWKAYVNSADDPQPIKLEEYVRAIVEVCNTYSIPVFNSSLDGGVMMYNATFRRRYCQGDSDRSHFNSGGHWYFLNKAEKFIESL